MKNVARREGGGTLAISILERIQFFVNVSRALFALVVLMRSSSVFFFIFVVDLRFAILAFYRFAFLETIVLSLTSIYHR